MSQLPVRMHEAPMHTTEPASHINKYKNLQETLQAHQCRFLFIPVSTAVGPKVVLTWYHHARNQQKKVRKHSKEVPNHMKWQLLHTNGARQHLPRKPGNTNQACSLCNRYRHRTQKCP